MRKLIFLFLSFAVLLSAAARRGRERGLRRRQSWRRRRRQRPRPRQRRRPRRAMSALTARLFLLPAGGAGRAKYLCPPASVTLTRTATAFRFPMPPAAGSPLPCSTSRPFSPREDFFSPRNWYHDYSASISIKAMGEDCVIIRIGPIGGSEIWPEDPLFDDYMETCEAAGAALAGSIAVDGRLPSPAWTARPPQRPQRNWKRSARPP